MLQYKTQGKNLLETPTRIWKDNINMYLRKTVCISVNWTELAKDSSMADICEASCSIKDINFLQVN
jgi:hypothetical protein